MRAFPAALVALALAPFGERLEAVYPQDSELVCAQVQTFSMEIDDVAITLGDMELPPDALEGMELPPTTSETARLRIRDVVLESADGRPTKVRRTLEELREVMVDDGTETQKTGPLEGRTLLLTEEDGELSAELEDEGDEVGAEFLADQRLTRDADLLLPHGAVEVGDSWTLEEDDLRLFFGLEAAPLWFEPDEEDEDEAFQDALDEASQISGTARLLESEERGGFECAVIAFEIEVEATVDDLAALGMGPEEGMEGATGSVTIRLHCTGKLWHAQSEQRAVEIEQDVDGTMTMLMEMRVQADDEEFVMTLRMEGTVAAESTCTWSAPE